jgi:hypothetical protein
MWLGGSKTEGVELVVARGRYVELPVTLRWSERPPSHQRAPLRGSGGIEPEGREGKRGGEGEGEVLLFIAILFDHLT